MSSMSTQHDWNALGSEIMDTRNLIAVADEIRDALDEDGDPDGLPVDVDEAREILASIEEIENAGITDWQYGETLIREDYFTTYAQELADDIGAIDSNAGWPLAHIDWDAAADALKIDYTEVEYLGTTYYVRA